MNIRDEYHNETGLYYYDTSKTGFEWSDEYIEWLENKVEAKKLPSDECEHEIVDARNQVIQDGRVCVKCGKLFKGNP